MKKALRKVKDKLHVHHHKHDSHEDDASHVDPPSPITTVSEPSPGARPATSVAPAVSATRNVTQERGLVAEGEPHQGHHPHIGSHEPLPTVVGGASPGYGAAHEPYPPNVPTVDAATSASRASAQDAGIAVEPLQPPKPAASVAAAEPAHVPPEKAKSRGLVGGIKGVAKGAASGAKGVVKGAASAAKHVVPGHPYPEEDAPPVSYAEPVRTEAPPKTPEAAPTVVADGEKQPIVITLKHLFYAWIVGTVLLLLMGLEWERPSIWEFVLTMLVFLPIGWLQSYLAALTRKRKQESNNLLRVNPGIKGLNHLLGTVPSWISFKEKERADVLNGVIKEMWPFIDKAVAQSVKEAVEPLFDQYKPGFVSKIGFREFTFGGAPIELDNVWVDQNTRDKVVMEVDLRWSADTANIALAVDMLGGTDLTRLVVRVTDIALSGTARVTFQPLIGEYPGFGAMTVALMGIPILRYRPDFGKLGGQFSAKGVQVWLDGMIRNVLLGMMVWPERIVIPMADVKVTGPLDNLYLHNVGALRVDVIEAKGLTNKDRMSKSDPFVEAFTNPKQREATRVINNNLDPKWNERMWFLIQEPDTQYLYVECYDHDNVSVKEMIKLNINGGYRELIGRCKVNLKDVCANAGVDFEEWYDLGREEFSNSEGCVSCSSCLNAWMQRVWERVRCTFASATSPWEASTHPLQTWAPFWLL